MKKNYISLILCCQIAIIAQGFAQELTRTCDSDFQINTVSKQNNVEYGITDFSNNWPLNKEIKILFLDGTENIQTKIKTTANKWMQYANVNFSYVKSEPSDVRISFNGQGSWSNLGKNTYSTGPTMNFGWLNENSRQDEIERVVLHEFGHMLGLLHEHKHPNRTFDYNIPVVLNHYYQKGWDKEKIYRSVIDRYDNTSELSNKIYDPLSIMHYSIPAKFTQNGYSVEWNRSLSEGDKEIIMEMYPFKKIDENLVNFDDIEIVTDFVKNDRKGILLLVNYSIQNDENEEHFFSTKITFESEELPYENFDRNLYSKEEKHISDNYDWNNKIVLFIPYEEFGLECGNYKLKLSLNINRRNQNISAGARFFTFTNNCAVIENLEVSKSVDEIYQGKKGIKVYANFKIKDARYSRLDFAIVYLPKNKNYSELSYFEKLGDYHTMRYIEVPRSNIEIKNNDFFLFLPYDKIGDGTIPIKLHLVVRQRNTFIDNSNWLYFNPK